MFEKSSSSFKKVHRVLKKFIKSEKFIDFVSNQEERKSKKKRRKTENEKRKNDKKKSKRKKRTRKGTHNQSRLGGVVVCVVYDETAGTQFDSYCTRFSFAFALSKQK